MYRASARIWVQRSMFSGGHTSQPGEIPESPLMEGATNLATFCEVVQSDAVLNLAHDELEKKLPAASVPNRCSLSSIRAVPAKDANIITLEFKSGDPKVATVVVESVIQALMKENSMQIAGPLEETRERLNKQLEIARQEYVESKERLKDFQKSVGTIDFQEEVQSMSAARSDLTTQLDESTNELKALQTKIEFLQQQLGFGPDDVMAVEKISNDEIVNNLKQTIASTEVKLIELKSKFQDEHPRVKRLKAVLETAKTEMAARYALLIGKVDAKFEGISKDNDAQHQLLGEMIEASTEVVAGQSKIQSLKQSIVELNERMSALPKKQQELSDLQRQDELATNTLAAVESELQRVKLTESVSLSSSRLQVIDSGESSEMSGSITWAMVLAGALFVALLVATIQHLTDPRVLSGAHLRLLGLRMVGWYPSLTGGIVQAVPHADRLRLAVRNWLSESKIFWITSANEGDGKSLVATSLSESFADAGFKVALIDANLSHPTLHVDFGESASPGLTQYLQGDADLPSVIREIRSNFKFIPAGSVSSNLRPLSSVEFEQLIRNLGEAFDVVIIDTPSAGHDECALQIADCRPNLLVVARMRHTIRAYLQTLKNQLLTLQFCEVGFVLNEIKASAVTKLGREFVAPASEETTPQAAPTPNTESVGSASW